MLERRQNKPSPLPLRPFIDATSVMHVTRPLRVVKVIQQESQPEAALEIQTFKRETITTFRDFHDIVVPAIRKTGVIFEQPQPLSLNKAKDVFSNDLAKMTRYERRNNRRERIRNALEPAQSEIPHLQVSDLLKKEKINRSFGAMVVSDRNAKVSLWDQEQLDREIDKMARKALPNRAKDESAVNNAKNACHQGC